MSPSPTIMPEASSTPSCLVGLRLRAPLGVPVEEVPRHRAHHHHERALRRQVDAEPHGERRQVRAARQPAQQCVGGDDHHADQAADLDQAPVDVVLDHSLCQGRYQSRLRRRQRMLVVRSRGAGEAVGPVQQIKNRRDDRSTGDHADHQRHLLLPRRGVDQLAGLEILQVVVGDRRGGEHHRGDEQRIGDQGLADVARRYPRGMPNTRISAKPMTARMPMPESGLFEEPMRPAM